MVDAITSSGLGYHYASSDSVGGLQAQLARYQKQLSECINCSSYDTPAGKRDAQQLYDKIAQVQARIEQIQQKQANKPADQATDSTINKENQAIGNLGKNINIFV